MGAKRAVQGRSRKYDDLLIDWQRAHNPNFVEPVKRETKAEKKEKREKEKLEKKKLAEEHAVALGVDPSALKKQGIPGPKKGGKKASAAAAVRMAVGDDNMENLDDLDSEAEMDELVQAVRDATTKGIIGVPLAAPCDAGTWFVQRRERLRCCRDLLVGALSNSNGNLAMGMGGRGSLSLAGRG
jgi:SAGA-associated factor 73